jgi:hypothetical protein
MPSDLPNPEAWIEQDGWWWNQAIDTSTSKMTVKVAPEPLTTDILSANPDLKFGYGFIYRATDQTKDNKSLACNTIKAIASHCAGSSVVATMAGMIKVEELVCE